MKARIPATQRLHESVGPCCAAVLPGLCFHLGIPHRVIRRTKRRSGSTLNGEVVGREEFSIRQAGAGAQAQLILSGTVELDLPNGPINLAPAMS